MPRLLVALTLGLAVLLLTFNGAAAQVAAPEVDAFGLYRIVGRAWTIKSVTWQRGRVVVSEYRRYEVTAYQSDLCTLKTMLVDKDGFELGGDQARDVKLDADLKLSIIPPADAKSARLEAAGTLFACTLAESDSSDAHTSIWRSTKFPALVVREQIVKVDAVELRELVSFNEGVPDPWTLYRMVGRKWTYQVKDGAGKISHSVHEVMENSASWATVKISRLDQNKKPIDGDAGEEVKIDFEKNTPWARPEMAKDRDVAEGTIEAGNIKWASVSISGAVGRTDMSKNWPGLLLSEKTADRETVLLEFCTGHDPMKLYRKQGNFALTKTVMKMNMGGRGGMNVASYMRQEVISVSETEASLRMTGYDQNLRKTFSNENTMSISKAVPLVHRGDEPLEERITLGLGSFNCIKTLVKNGDQTTLSWMHNGIMLRMSTQADGYTMMMEVTDLKLE